ncbi:MAG: 1-acyl-sn-glycerol-3-phosphate acyltransferase [Helicobacteraceae bacterium CG2_30_36_10]|nr:MAG: 1-acyl-sn-glycerol-3-phosphate acyltransferase [Helicobacteraceae bacterium CG2_30_36_10]
MTFNKIKMAIYATFLTNYYGFRLKKALNTQEKKRLRVEYSKLILDKLNIEIDIINRDKFPKDGQFLLVSNHRSIIDPLIVENIAKDSSVYGHWVAKKELYNSFFFGLFVRNGGTILLDRESSQMSFFFKEIKECVKAGNSIFIFPEGTRNKSANVLGEFQGGAQLIAVKNKLLILPVYIRSNADEILKLALKNPQNSYKIEVQIGDIIDYKDRSVPLEEAYKKQFNIS